MKTRGHILGSLLILGILSACPAYAQEEGFNFSPSDNSENGTPASTEGEHTLKSYTEPVSRSKNENATRVEKNSTQTDVAEKKAGTLKNEQTADKHTHEQQEEVSTNSTGAQNSQGKDESVLSFNFLYYMIQKFKFSDVIDQ